MPELQVDALISDMDGVLVDTGGIYDHHWVGWAERHGVEPDRIARVHPGRPAVETIRLVAPHLDAVAEARRYNEGLARDDDDGGVGRYPARSSSWLRCATVAAPSPPAHPASWRGAGWTTSAVRSRPHW